MLKSLTLIFLSVIIYFHSAEVVGEAAPARSMGDTAAFKSQDSDLFRYRINETLNTTEKGQHSAITPVPCSEWAAKRCELVMQRSKSAPGDYDIEFIGDSITDYWEREGVEVWKEFYGHRKTINLGVTADRTQHVLWRIQNGQLDGINPKIAVVLIGTNNTKNAINSEQEILEGVSMVVDQIRKRQPHTKILLLGIFPCGPTFSERRGKILQVNQALAKLDNGKNVFYLDVGFKFIDEDGSISNSIMPDGVHLSDVGYRIWATSMEPKLQQLLN